MEYSITIQQGGNLTTTPHKSHKNGFLSTIVAKLQAKQQFNEIMKGRNEAELIHKGLKKAKTFDDFLNEL